MQERKLLKFALTALILLLTATAASYYWFSQSSLPLPKRQKRITANQSATMPESGGKVNILVMGVDHRQDDVGRSDTLLVVTLDTKTKQTSILSLPRDTRVKIPGYGYDKINHAYSLGGHQLTQRTVEELLAAPIDYYAEIDFAGFSKIVDAVGGVDIDVEKRMYYEDPYDDLIIDFHPGLQHMNGENAIKYVRYRDEEGDIGRIERQQKFIRAMMDEATSPSILVKLPAAISEISNTIRSDLSLPEMIGIGRVLKEAKEKGLKTDMAPGTPIDIGEISYLHPDIVALREYMAQSLGFKADDNYLAAAKRVAIEYQNSLPDETTTGKETSKPGATKQDKTKPGAIKPGVTKPGQTITPTNPVAPQRPNQPKAPATQTGPIRADVVNASGDPAAGEKMASQLRQQGFTVNQVSSSSNVNRHTIVIARSSQEAVLNKVTSLPFNYALQVSPQAGSVTQVTVVIGKDYTSR